MKAKAFVYLILFLMACSGNEDDKSVLTKSDALILGTDDSFCECCVEQAYFIEIDDLQYRFFYQELPEEFMNFLNSADVSFPLPVRIHWKPNADQCMGNEILIKKISIIQATPF